ncbi:MAG: RNA polymerase sigma factor [Lachnospiraceae bacterium]|nr:RNA polymerase sigma factor [Lachnospiraceae bacterium]
MYYYQTDTGTDNGDSLYQGCFAGGELLRKGGDKLDKGTDGQDLSAEQVFFEYGNTLYRIAFVMMKNSFDAEDVVQDTLIKYMECAKHFETEEYRKAWLIRVNINLCKNRLRFYKNHPKISMEQLSRYYESQEDTRLMDSLLLLPEKYREVLMLHYVEGYQGKEIARMLKLTEASVRKRLERGRRKLREILGED